MLPSTAAARDHWSLARVAAAVATVTFAAGIASPQTRGAPPQPAGPGAGVEQETINLDMVDREIAEVIQQIAEMTGRNFI